MKLTKRNKVVVPVVLLLGIVVGGAVVLQTKGILAALLDAGRKVTYDCLSDPNADCDNDGLKNWQEKLYHTDPNNPDTDGDGYLDGEEVASGYDPTVKAPNDALPGTDTNKPRALPKNLTLYLTQLMSKKISTGEIVPSKDGTFNATDPAAPQNQEALNDAMAQVALRAQEYFTLPEVRDSDITISQNQTTREEIVAYISAMANTLQNDGTNPTLETSELSIIRDAIMNKQPDALILRIGYYDKIIAQTKAVTVPRDFTSTHKKQIAILMLNQKILNAIKDFQNDPLTAAAAVETYPKTLEMLKNLSDELIDKIRSYKQP